MKRVLGLFAKWPQPGQVKTRLAGATSPDHAAAVARAFLCDMTERLSAVDAIRVLAFAPRDSYALFSQLVGGRYLLMPQADGDLGRRLSVFFPPFLAMGAESLIVVGTD